MWTLGIDLKLGAFFCRNQQEMRDANRVPFDERTSNYLEAVSVFEWNWGTGCRCVSWLSANHAFDDFFEFSAMVDMNIFELSRGSTVAQNKWLPFLH